MARWKLHQDSFIDNGRNGGGQLFAAGSEVALGPLRPARGEPGEPGYREAEHHRPGPHWEPLDDEAKAIARKAGHMFTGEVPDVVEDLTRQLEEAQKKAAAAQALSPQDIAQLAAQAALAVLEGKGDAPGGKPARAAKQADAI